MSIIGYSTLQVIPSLKGMEDKVRDQLGKAAPAAQGAGDSAGQGFAGRFSSAVGSMVRSVSDTIVSGLETAGVVAGGVLATSLFKGWDRLTTIEDSAAALEITLGDATKAGALLDEVLGVVRGTPFNLDQFADAAKRLAGMGIEAEKVPGYLTAIGEASATQGKRANEFAQRLSNTFGQVAAKGQIQLMDVWSISETGVNALAILANHFGLTREEMKAMISDGAVPAGEALDALAKGIVEGSDGPAGATVALAGTMEKLRTTLSGSVGGLGAAMARFGVSILQPFSGALTTAFSTFSDFLDEAGERVGQKLAGLADSPGFQRFTAWLSEVPEKIGPAIDRLRDLGPIVGGLAGAFAAFGTRGLSSAIPMLGKLIPVVNPILGLFAGLVAASPELRTALLELLEALAGVATQLLEMFGPLLTSALELVVPLLVLAAETLTVLFTWVGDNIDTVATFVGVLGGFLIIQKIISLAVAFKAAVIALNVAMWANPALLIAGAIAALAAGLVWAYQNVEPFRQAVDAVGRALERAFGAVVGWIQDLVDAFQQGGVMGLAKKLFDAWLRWFKALYIEIPKLVLRALGALASAVWDWIKSETPKLLAQLGDWAMAFVDWVPGATLDLLKALGELLLQVGYWIVEGSISLIENFGEWVHAFAAWVPGAALGLLKALAELLLDVGTWIVNEGAPTLLRNLGEWALAFAKWVPGALLNLIAALLGLLVDFGKWIIGDGKDQIIGAGIEFGGKLLEGIKDGVLGLLRWLWELPGKIIDWVKEAAQALFNAGTWIGDKIAGGIRHALNPSNWMPSGFGIGPRDGRSTWDWLTGKGVIRHAGGLIPGARGQEVNVTALAGEMYLTEDQQAALFRAIQDGQLGGDGMSESQMERFVRKLVEALAQIEWAGDVFMDSLKVGQALRRAERGLR